MAWQLHHEGADPELDKVIARRFGPDHDLPCERREMITCAMWECQIRNRCRYADNK